jgi:hypothetical protein
MISAAMVRTFCGDNVANKLELIILLDNIFNLW